jgi:hypothetical protein
MTTYWPDTKIVKSQGNAFDWRAKVTVITDDKNWKQGIVGARNASLKKANFTIYSKAKASK